MTQSNKTTRTAPAIDEAQKLPTLNIRKIGIVARDYNRAKSFGDSLPDVLKLLDKKGCDAVLFSLFSLKNGHDTYEVLEGLKNIRAVFVETFSNGKNQKTGEMGRRSECFIVYHRTPSGWKEYRLTQQFATLTGRKKGDIHAFVENELPNRCLGNCCVLLCGESNGVKYSKDDGKIHDTFKLRKMIPEEVRIVLNPCHDYMTRFEMKMKREFLSKNGRWVISVWNKGKNRDGKGPAWTIYHNGKEHVVDETIHDFDAADVYVGILNVR